MKSTAQRRRRGVEKLMPIEDYNNCFFYAFGVYGASVLDTKNKALYCYGLRRICGYTFPQISAALGMNKNNVSSAMITEACRKLCIYDPWYCEQFVYEWGYLRKVCEPFRRPLSKSEMNRRYAEKKKRDKARRAGNKGSDKSAPI